MPVHLQSYPAQPPPGESPPKDVQEKAAACPAQKRKSSSKPLRLHPSTSFNPNAAPQKMEPLRMNDLQSEFISDTMSELRQTAAKRPRIGELRCAPNASFSNGSDDYGNVEFDIFSDSSDDCESGQFDILDELDSRPGVVHIVATAGGLIANWNEGFAGLTRPSASLREIPLTVFELVDSGSLPKLYGMLALALHDVGIIGVEQFRLNGNEEEEVSSPSHLSITLPCKKFTNSSTHYDITILFMPDAALTRRCFLGILTPRSNGRGDVDDDTLSTGRASSTEAPAPSSQLPRGRILRVGDELLCRLLLGPADAVE